MTKIIVVLIEVVFFTALIGTIASSVGIGDGNKTENLSGTALALYGLITLFVVIGFIIALMKTLGIKSSNR